MEKTSILHLHFICPDLTISRVISNEIILDFWLLLLLLLFSVCGLAFFKPIITNEKMYLTLPWLLEFHQKNMAKEYLH